LITLDGILSDLVDSQVPLSTSLRKSYILARQLQEPTLLEWVKNELYGYDLTEPGASKNFPDYRRPNGFLQGRTPDAGERPIFIPDATIKDILSSMMLPYPIGQLEAFAQESKTGTISISMDEKTTAIIRRATSQPALEPFLEYTHGAFAGILETVRNKLLDLMLELQSRFPDLKVATITEKERKEAAPVILQVINNPVKTHIVGLQHLSIPWDELIATLQSELKKAGAPQESSTEFTELLTEANKEATSGSGKKSARQRVFEWMDRNKQWITDTAITLVKAFLPGSS
jgi:hypothetical protein